MRAGVVIILVVIGLAAAACPGLLSDARISEGEAAKFADRNAEVAASLPVFAASRLVSDRQYNCEGALQREDSSCALDLTYETSQPLVQVLPFYESYFTSTGWKNRDLDVVRTLFFHADGLMIQVFVMMPFQACPESHTDPDAARACEEKWVLSHGGEFSVSIGPD